jgi:PPOX class probable F420-dependent enzyme
MLDLASAKDSKIDRRLRTEPIIWLSSTRPDGRPHLVPVWFWWDGHSILIFSEPDKPKVRNIRHSPHVMLALDSKDDGEDIVMIVGLASLPDEPSAVHMPAAFGEKYASLFDRIGSTPAKMATQYSQVIRVAPTRFLAW